MTDDMLAILGEFCVSSGLMKASAHVMTKDADIAEGPKESISFAKVSVVISFVAIPGPDALCGEIASDVSEARLWPTSGAEEPNRSFPHKIIRRQDGRAFLLRT